MNATDAPDPATTSSPADLAALRAEAARLFAAHDAMAAEHAAKVRTRTEERTAAFAADRAAAAAEDGAYEALDQAEAAHRADPTDPGLAAAVRTAEAAWETARVEADAAARAARDVAARQASEVGAETEALLELGAQARAVQDAAYFTASPASTP
ncbi:hypothetical protein ACFFX1_10950 [Dactylosporangium sucinum]|uniref:Uncharacterized protein n=1 Tax=Dactylosporangium sucinum TaxID=1424081 RepID=A0A917TGK4_9ACTN|nr:hypothetical protein [Dactylosporangium sucinum]GGM22725.1 hypothetical protein GCM10007977_024880 [Dactylosporangium sucinum]